MFAFCMSDACSVPFTSLHTTCRGTWVALFEFEIAAARFASRESATKVRIHGRMKLCEKLTGVSRCCSSDVLVSTMC